MSPREMILGVIAEVGAGRTATTDEMENGMGKTQGGGGSGGGFADESNAPDESLDAHIKRFHKGIMPKEPCAWMIKHGMGGPTGAVAGAPKGMSGQSGAAAAQIPQGQTGETVATGQSAPQKVAEPNGQLKSEMGEVGLKTQQGAANLTKLESLYQQADTPEKKDAIKKIYKNLQAAVKGNGGQSQEEIDRIKAEVAQENAEIERKEGNAKRAIVYKKSEKKKIRQDYEDAFKDAEHAVQSGRMTRKEADKIQRKAEKNYFQRLDDLDEMSDDDIAKVLHEKVLKSLASNYVPRQHANLTPARKSFQQALQRAHQRGVAAAANTLGKRFLGAAADAAKSAKSAFKAFAARQGAKQPSESRAKVHGVLEKFNERFAHMTEQTTYRDAIRQYKEKHGIPAQGVSPDIQSRFDELLKQHGGDIMAAAKALASGQSTKGASGATATSAVKDGLRQTFGGIKANSQHVKDMVDELEEEFANAKTRKEKMEIMKEFQSLRKIVGEDEYKPQTQTAAQTQAPAGVSTTAGAQEVPSGMGDELQKYEGLTDFEQRQYKFRNDLYKRYMSEGKYQHAKAVADEWSGRMKDKKAFSGFDNAKEDFGDDDKVVGNY